ncbi:hypothetical protein BCR42DRAFT_35205 [Absidia repens]|uniref:Uncharacterized protein n=1 Tax=Absidia repens TaxID=90262 RepID=A0A1X2IH86_9FUNG|nr:hypothetical protein BCR42DRAFT_35205 [Absidia repens]
MGQEQSFNSKTRDLLSDGATKEQHTHRRTLSNSHSTNTNDQEQSRTSSEQVDEEEVMKTKSLKLASPY